MSISESFSSGSSSSLDVAETGPFTSAFSGLVSDSASCSHCAYNSSRVRFLTSALDAEVTGSTSGRTGTAVVVVAVVVAVIVVAAAAAAAAARFDSSTHVSLVFGKLEAMTEQVADLSEQIPSGGGTGAGISSSIVLKEVITLTGCCWTLPVSSPTTRGGCASIHTWPEVRNACRCIGIEKEDRS